MPLPGKLVLKGGQTLKTGGVEKSKKKSKNKLKKSSEAEQAGAETDKQVGNGATDAKTYEEEFHFEMDRANQGKARSTPWGVSYGRAPEILHGYSKPVTGSTQEERLDLRCAKKADRMCK